MLRMMMASAMSEADIPTDNDEAKGKDSAR
jgi:hypothetical protein